MNFLQDILGVKLVAANMSQWNSAHRLERASLDLQRELLEKCIEINEAIFVPLKERILYKSMDKEQYLQLQTDILSQNPDLFVLSHEKCVNVLNENIITKMSHYFDGKSEAVYSQSLLLYVI